jgi:hypothetical protein
MRAAVDHGAGHADTGGVYVYRMTEEVRACGFETEELGGRIAALANDFDRFAREAEKSQMGFRTTDVAGQEQTSHIDLARVNLPL